MAKIVPPDPAALVELEAGVADDDGDHHTAVHEPDDAVDTTTSPSKIPASFIE